jgi:hypothetical protein
MSNLIKTHKERILPKVFFGRPLFDFSLLTMEKPGAMAWQVAGSPLVDFPVNQ